MAVVFTSGTTGEPKGAVFTWRQLEAIGDVDGGGRWGNGGRGLSSTSFAHLGYMTKLPQALRGGGTSFLMARWSAGDALDMVERHRITTLGGIPTQVALMLAHDRFESTDTSSVRMIAMGGGPSTAALVREARARFAVPVVVRYTCTEAGVGVGTMPDDPPEDAEETVGRARRGVELTIRADDDRPLAPGDMGHVCLRSPAVMLGYWHDPGATAAAITADGAVRTGDLGYVDERGRLHLSGRSKEMYVRGGYNVYPLEVENVLADHPAVAHVAVVPRLDPVMGEIGVAVVVPRPGEAPTLETLRGHARERLAAYKLPEAIVLTAELPRTAMEKVDRRALAALVGAGPDTPGTVTGTDPPRDEQFVGRVGIEHRGQDGVGHLLALQHVIAQPAVGHPRLEGGPGHLGVPAVGERRRRVSHRHAQDLERGLLGPQAPGHLGQGRFGGAVHPEPWPRSAHRMRRHHHDGMRGAAKMLEGVAHDQRRSHQVGGEHLVPELGRRLGHADERRAPREIEHDVDPAHPRRGLGDEPGAVGPVGHVAAPRPRLTARPSDLVGGLLHQRQAARRQRHPGAGPARGHGQGAPDPRGRAHDEHAAAFQAGGGRHRRLRLQVQIAGR